MHQPKILFHHIIGKKHKQKNHMHILTLKQIFNLKILINVNLKIQKFSLKEVSME